MTRKIIRLGMQELECRETDSARLPDDKAVSIQTRRIRKPCSGQKNIEEGDAQSGHINKTAVAYMSNSQPVISADCKKKENIGNFKNNGAEYAPVKQPVKVFDHDFPIAGMKRQFLTVSMT